jgi:prepilin-type N-terminal cleavage/methylation domain-containing protein
MKNPVRFRGFTLLELLTAIAIIALLSAIVFPVVETMRKRGQQTAGLSNIRQVGAAFLLYAGEHDYQLPGRTTLKHNEDRWPKLLAQYLQDLRVYAAPGDLQNYINRGVDPLSNTTNNTSFIMNGYNDLGTVDDPDVEIRINRFDSASSTILIGTPKSGSIHFFMDFLEPPHGNNKDILNLHAYGDGSNYFFIDGSARFIAEKDYDDKMWLVNKDFKIPEL